MGLESMPAHTDHPRQCRGLRRRYPEVPERVQRLEYDEPPLFILSYAGMWIEGLNRLFGAELDFRVSIGLAPIGRLREIQQRVRG